LLLFESADRTNYYTNCVADLVSVTTELYDATVRKRSVVREFRQMERQCPIVSDMDRHVGNPSF